MEDYSQLRALTERISKQIEDFYNGDLWVTDNLYTKILSLSSEVVFKRIGGHTHSIAEQLAHIIAWRNFGVQKLTGNDSFNIEDNTLSDWPTSVEWDLLKKQFKTCHYELLMAIKNFPVEKWNAIVPGRSYSFIYLINGIVEHDYYHYGQIGCVLAAIEKAAV